MRPETGRFWSMDSHEGVSSDPASLHKYLYAGADPANKIDPSGNSFISQAMAVVASVMLRATVFVLYSQPLHAVLRLTSAAIAIRSYMKGDDGARDAYIVAAGSPYEASQSLADDAALIFRNFGRSITVAPVVGKLLNGSGPVPGVIEVSSRVQSTRVLQHYYPGRGGRIEFVFDPATNTFAVGKPAAHLNMTGSPHVNLASSINADQSKVLGGTFARGPGGEIRTDEFSGHFGHRWNEAYRKQFVEFMESLTGLSVTHSPW